MLPYALNWLHCYFYKFKFILDEQINSSTPSPMESPVRTLAARKAYDEPLDISIQRKVNEKFDDDDFKKTQR